MYKLSNDELLKLIFGYVGEKNYRFVACASYRFHQEVYLDTFRGDASTSIVNAVASLSYAAVCLHLEELGCESRAESLFKTAAKEGKLEIEDSGYELKKMLDQEIIADAALNRLEVVKYLRQLDVSWDGWTCLNAAKNGHFELLKWARAHQCPWNEKTCTYAAKNGHLELLKWARSNRCPWDEETYELGKENGNPALMRYLEDEGCPTEE